MKIKEMVILAVIIVLLGGYLFLRPQDRTRYALPNLAAVNEKEISRIDITASGATLQLTRKDSRWRIGEKGFPADEALISSLLSVLKTLSLTALVSESKAYDRYDLGDAKKITVRAWAGESLVRHLDIGKEASTYQQTLIRLGEDPNIYQAQGSFRDIFNQTVDSLRDKSVLSFTPAGITRIEVNAGGTLFSLQRTEAAKTTGSEDKGAAPVWADGDGKEKKTEAVATLLSELSRLTCDHYLEAALDGQKQVIEITLKGEKTYHLSIFEKTAAGSPAVSSQSEEPFILSEQRLKGIEESLSALAGKGSPERTQKTP